DFCRNAKFGKMGPIVGDIGMTNDGCALPRRKTGEAQRLSSFPLFVESRRREFMEIPHGSTDARDRDQENHCQDDAVRKTGRYFTASLADAEEHRDPE